MRRRRFAGLAAGALALTSALATGAYAQQRQGEAKADFYVLSLSWSPSYCAALGDKANRRQCAVDRDLAFVVHGLWPQHEHGYPKNCRSDEPSRVPDALVSRYLDLIPSAGLIGAQWRRHGTCSGLDQSDYFALIRKARNRINLPSFAKRQGDPAKVDPRAVETAFLKANPGMPAKGVAVTCDRQFLREVRICMTGDLTFRPCLEVDRNACRRPAVAMPTP